MYKKYRFYALYIDLELDFFMFLKYKMEIYVIFAFIYLNIIHYIECDYILANLGDQVTLNCSVSITLNESPDSITWYKYSEPVENFISVSFKNYTLYGDGVNKISTYVNDNLTYSTITIFGVDATDKGYYGCKFTVGDCAKEYTNQIAIRDTIYYSWSVFSYRTIVLCYIVSSKEKVTGNWRVRGIVTNGIKPDANLVTDTSLLKGSAVIQLQVNNVKDAVENVICRPSFDGVVIEYSINMNNTLPSTLYTEYGDVVERFNVVYVSR